MTASRIMSTPPVSAVNSLEPRPSRRWLAPVYPALRLDLTFAHLIAATVRLVATKPERWQAAIETNWGEGEAVTFLSVRSAFVALLEALDWPARSEILITGINIADMARIIESFGHIAVPVDIGPATLAPDIAEVVEKIGPNTRGIVVAHLFGGHIDTVHLLEVARRHRLLVIEDCAQAYTTREARGTRKCDVRFFSFGLLKTGTALGGAVAEVGDAALRSAMRNIQGAWRRQSRRRYAAKIAKAFMFLLLQRPVAYSLFSSICLAAGSSSGPVLRRLTRGFSSGDTASLMRALRQRPCAPLVATLAWRLANCDSLRLARRVARGEQMMAGLADLAGTGITCVGAAQTARTHWLFPVSVPNPSELRSDLARAGFDAHGASNVVAIGGSSALAIVKGLVFVPCYPEMDEVTCERVRDIVRSHCLSRA